MEVYWRPQDPQAMPKAALRRMVRGVSTRDYAKVVDRAADGSEHLLGLRHGGTENAEVCTGLLEDLRNLINTNGGPT